VSRTVITVLGECSPDDLGIVLPHEHLVFDMTCLANPEPSEIYDRERRKQLVTLGNRGHVIYHPFDYNDNLVQTDLSIATEEAMRFKLAGGGTICDLTVNAIGRDPSALYNIALVTGLNIIMGCSYYVVKSLSQEEKKLSEEEVKNKIIHEFKNGVGYNRIKPGIIGEVGISDISNEIELKNLRASGKAQKIIGCAINIHTPAWEKDGNRILDILESVGTKIDKVVLSHLDPTMNDFDYADSLAKRGAYIEYDQFGMHFMSNKGFFMPDDGSRIIAIKEQIRRGNIERILISQDVFLKILLTKWGGHGYAHILENIVPRLIQEGLTEEQISAILVENPKRLFSW